MAALVCLSLATTALGVAVQIADGFYDASALTWLTVALVLTAAATANIREKVQLSPGAEIGIRAVMAAGIAWQLASLLAQAPGMYVRPGANLDVFRAGVIAQGVAIGLGVAGIRTVRSFWFPVLLVLYAALGIWMLDASPNPHIDVVVVHRAAFDALLGGGNPYDITFENIYGPASGFYNPQAIVGDRVMFGYPYPPVSLLATLPAHIAVGDYRYAHIVAIAAAGALIGYMRRGLVPKLAAVLLLTHPRGFFVLEQGWTEPVTVFFLTATLFAMNRGGTSAAWLSGALIASKQYLALGIPLLVRYAWRGRSTVRDLTAAGLVVVALALPFIVWNPRAFIEHTLLLQSREPFRIDSLSYLSWAARHGWGQGSFVWAVAAGGAAAALGLGKSKSAAGFAGTLALSTFAFFAFGSKAFCNYYYFVAACLACTTASTQVEARTAGLDARPAARQNPMLDGEEIPNVATALPPGAAGP
jgi:hypothetical protein